MKFQITKSKFQFRCEYFWNLVLEIWNFIKKGDSGNPESPILIELNVLLILLTK